MTKKYTVPIEAVTARMREGVQKALGEDCAAERYLFRNGGKQEYEKGRKGGHCMLL